ncbi:hypothetical protein DFH29DRAFT_883383 [Suillus ampliporus]|nr:hypothetical protein DFH29DRAFT_883383 [Suillus ampliporus]
MSYRLQFQQLKKERKQKKQVKKKKQSYMVYQQSQENNAGKVPGIGADSCGVTEPNFCDHSKFMELLTDEVQKECFRTFQEATSNRALAMSICVVCAREMMAYEGEKLFILSIPNIKQRLRLAIVHPSYDLWEEMLLVKHDIEGEGPSVLGWNCSTQTCNPHTP